MKDATITPSPVARCYGRYNLNQDASANNGNHIEEALSVLEGAASNLIKKIKVAQASNEESVTLSRHERNVVRKFLVVIKYRTRLFWTKYNCTLED